MEGEREGGGLELIASWRSSFSALLLSLSEMGMVHSAECTRCILPGSRGAGAEKKDPLQTTDEGGGFAWG